MLKCYLLKYHQMILLIQKGAAGRKGDSGPRGEKGSPGLRGPKGSTGNDLKGALF